MYRKQQAFREDLQRRRSDELAQVVERAHRVIRRLAEQRGTWPYRKRST